MLMILTSSLGSLFTIIQLNIYSLPFNIVVITFLYVLKLRKAPVGPAEVLVQHHSPEHNLYHNLSGKGRFKNFRPIAISLPVFGNWIVSQGPNGEHTHRGEWKDAWDFVLVDEDGKQYASDARRIQDYYCYNKPVIAPADGKVEQIIDDIADNVVGDSNLKQNWGNSIVIKHGYQLYSQLSHLKKGSIKVKSGDHVSKGEIIAACGNSGRSPEPHLHFQIQATPFIGSKTLAYPLSHFMVKRNGAWEFEFYNFPGKGDMIKSIESDSLFHHAFHFLPGQVLSFEIKNGDNRGEETWEVKTDYYNNTYFECLNTNSKAFFNNDGTLFYFTQFKGNKDSLLYKFYLGAFRVLLSAQPDLTLNDEIPLHLYLKSRYRIIHDFVAPIFPYKKARFSLTYDQKSKQIGEESVSFRSKVKLSGNLFPVEDFEFKLSVVDYHIDQFTVYHQQLTLKAVCIKY